MKAVIPAAGLGTRMLPATKTSPKEMLPVVDKPAIQYVVEECVASGIKEILIITGRGKRAIEDYFDHTLELEHLLERKGDKTQLEAMRRIADMAEIHYVRQKEQKGLGHAIACARNYIGDEPFAVLLGDDIVVSEVPCTKQLMRHYHRHGRSVLGVETVPPEKVESYGIVSPGARLDEDLYIVKDLVEKPKRAEAPSNLGILGRYILTPEIFDAIENTSPGKNNEIQLTDAIRLLLKTQQVYAAPFEGKRYDLGSKIEWLKTNVELALAHPEVGKEFREFLEKYNPR
ncbi:MAG TPA: UTP--glucose-1-phosphate uridylyltransferase GalU [Candidatus Thermoplasmatota archaeon]|nr:UTP--glucose-1-phosphate uridylyltransferase GalU [Candidatus Thermoplasmatota archaeon]